MKGRKATQKQEHDIREKKKLQQVCLKKEEADPQKLNPRKLNKKK